MLKVSIAIISSRKSGAISAIVLISCFCCCRGSFNSTDYFPLAQGYQWEYTGPISTVTASPDVGAGEFCYILQFSDSAGTLRWQERYQITDGKILRRTLEPASPLLPHLQFTPAVFAAPYTAQSVRWQTTLTVHSANEQQRYDLEYEIFHQEKMVVPAGTFTDLIHMTVYFKPGRVNKPWLARQFSGWFARGVGVIKYDWNGMVGELKSASLGKKKKSSL